MTSLAGKYCGKTLPELVNASTQSLYIMFHSDELDAFKGFKAEWSSSFDGSKTSPTVKSAADGEIFGLCYITIVSKCQVRHRA